MDPFDPCYPRLRLSKAGSYAIVSPMDIRFGTDGWRAKMGKEFTFSNVKLVCQAFAEILKRNAKPDEKISVGVNYDTRYLSHEFALVAATIFTWNGIHAYLPERDSPLPVLSLAILQNRWQGGICFTASYNELNYNGIKLFDHRGTPLLPSKTALIEREIERLRGYFSFKPRYADDRFWHILEGKSQYLDLLKRFINFSLIRQSGLSVIVDNLYGTSRDYLDRILLEHDIPIISIHNYTDLNFGGVIPSCSKKNLKELARLVKEKNADVGIATDIDGDRFGIVDSQGHYMDANTLIPPLLEYLISIRKMPGDIAKSVSSTHQINQVAKHYLRKVYETPVGFKYLADLLVSKKAFIGVESTNGAALRDFLPIKDGLLFSLLVLEMMAYHRSSWSSLLRRFHEKFPRLYSGESSLPLTSTRKERFLHSLEKRNPSLSGVQPQHIQRLDGMKLIFPDGWLLLRLSGTSPCIRIYAESHSQKETKRLLTAGRSWIDGK